MVTVKCTLYLARPHKGDQGAGLLKSSAIWPRIDKAGPDLAMTEQVPTAVLRMMVGYSSAVYLGRKSSRAGGRRGVGKQEAGARRQEVSRETGGRT